jgi:hypothetical protein
VGLVASRKRGATVRADLGQRAHRRGDNQHPAGLDLGARTRPKSRLDPAEVVQRQPSGARVEAG